MNEHRAVRQLVKSRPELWAQCSDAQRLATHLSCFGELRITALEPESTVVWEGESVSGTVVLEASGWGTRVRLTARGAPALRAAVPGGEGSAPTLRAAPVWSLDGLTGRLRAWLGRRDGSTSEQASGMPAPQPDRVLDELEAALDSLGRAHHRPYSRA